MTGMTMRSGGSRSASSRTASRLVDVIKDTINGGDRRESQDASMLWLGSYF
jgi:hypothetical protein